MDFSNFSCICDNTVQAKRTEGNMCQVNVYIVALQRDVILHVKVQHMKHKISGWRLVKNICLVISC